jgi:hypothetical protein
MNYKTLIAFLGKNQMKDWATPKSDWIIAKNIGDLEWRNEFSKLMGCGKDAQIKRNMFAYIQRDRLSIRDWIQAPAAWSNFAFYYNNNLEFLLMSDVELVIDGGILDHLSNLSSEQIKQLNDTGLSEILK